MPTWVDSRIVLQEARCGGVGSFTIGPIRRGEIVMRQDGVVIPNTRLCGRDIAPFADHCFQIQKHFCVAPRVLEKELLDGIFRVNHSCEPSCGFASQISLAAMRDIAPGDEITYDYAMTDMDVDDLTCAEMRCLCGTPSCRGVVTSKDWLRDDLRRRYAGHFSPYIQTEIDRR